MGDMSESRVFDVKKISTSNSKLIADNELWQCYRLRYSLNTKFENILNDAVAIVERFGLDVRGYPD